MCPSNDRVERPAQAVGISISEARNGAYTYTRSRVRSSKIPRAQRHAPAPRLRQLQAQYKDQKKAMVAAYETGEYSYQQIGNHFGVHFTTVGRIVRGTSKDP